MLVFSLLPRMEVLRIVTMKSLMVDGASGMIAIAMTTALFAVWSPATAQSPGTLPFDTPTDVSGVETVCTGVDSDSRLDPRWSSYPLKVVIAGKGGQFLGDVQVGLEKAGKKLLQVSCGGPWLLFKLSPGRYQVSATIEGKTVTSAANALAKGQGSIILRFPEMGGALDDPKAEQR
jgi:hypothetical protein